MKNIKIIYTLFLLLTINLTSCKDDDSNVKPVVTASFTQDKELFLEEESNKTVTFTNTSANAVRYEWNFGNGQSSTIANPTAVFASTGTYTVSLTAYDSENNASTASGTVKIGSLYATKIKVIKFDFVNGGLPWDITTTFDPNNPYNHPDNYPDLVGILDMPTNETNVLQNVTPAMLPVTLKYNHPEKLSTLNTRFIGLRDRDDNNINDGFDDWDVNNLDLKNRWNRKEGEFTLVPEPRDLNQIAEIELTCEFLVK